MGLSITLRNANLVLKHAGHCPLCVPSPHGSSQPMEGHPKTHSSIFRPQCSLSLLWPPHTSIPPAGCFPQGSAHHLKLAPALLAPPRPPPAAGALPAHALGLSDPPGSEGVGDKPAFSIAHILQATCEREIPGVISCRVKYSPEVTFWLVRGWMRMRSGLALAS